MFCFLFITVAKALLLDSYSWLQHPGSFWFSSHILRTKHSMPPQIPQPKASGIPSSNTYIPALQSCSIKYLKNQYQLSRSHLFRILPQASLCPGSLSTLWTSSGQSPLLPHCQINRYYSDLIIPFCSNKINHSLGPPLDNIIFLSTIFGSLIYFWRVNWQNVLERILAILIQQKIFKHLWEYFLWVNI